MIRLTRFGGEIPRVAPRLLGDVAAQVARNVRLEDGALAPLRLPAVVQAVTGSVKTIYPDGDAWLTWDKAVAVAPAPIAEDRLYITGDGVPKVKVGATTYALAVPAPSSALTSVLETGEPDSEISATVLYTYTWVTALDEESEPAPLGDGVLWSEGLNVVLTGFQAAPADRGIDRMRIYRSQTSALGETELYLIHERSASTASFTDVVANNPIQELLQSIDYNAPPDGLAGLVAMPNGMMAAFMGKRLYFCQPYRPHAWPEKYILTTDYEIVGLGVFGSAVAVLTTGQPYIVAGTAPDTMSMEKMEVNLPCLSARGIVDMGYSVAYPSPEGLVIINTSGAQLVSRNLMTRDQWQRLTPSSFVASVYSGRYIASYTPAAGTSATIIVDLSGEQPFITHADLHASAMFSRIEGGQLYFVSAGAIREWDAPSAPVGSYVWRSKLFALPSYGNFGAFLADAEAPDGSPPSFAARIYADGVLRATVPTINQPARLPSGFTARTWEIEIESNCRVTALAIATSPSELAG
jgi:hypothetical protein